MLNWYLRYAPFIQILDAENAQSALDVGSGWSGLSWYWPRPVVQTDFTFDGAPPTGMRAGTAAFVRSSADRLPFADDSFDFAVSSDMVEHLPDEIRVTSIRELVRVARRGVIVGFPTGPDAGRLDRRLDRIVALSGRTRPAWLDEHLAQDRYPDRSVVEAALPSGWRLVSEFGNGNPTTQLAVVVAELAPGLRSVAALLERQLVRRRQIVPQAHGRRVREIYHLAPATSASPQLPER